MINQITKEKIAILADQYRDLVTKNPEGIAAIVAAELPEIVLIYFLDGARAKP